MNIIKRVSASSRPARLLPALALLLTLALVPRVTPSADADMIAPTTFLFTGGEQTYTVPSGVTTVHVVARGAHGGNGNAGPNGVGRGGRGAVVTGNLPVTPGQTLYIEVGGAATGTGTTGPCWPFVACIGGFNGGGSSIRGGGGGGASDVRTVSAALSGTLDSRLLVAAGGGGGGNSILCSSDPAGGIGGVGGDAGSNGGTGTNCGAVAGGAGGVAGSAGLGSGGGSAAGLGGAGGGGLIGGGTGGDADGAGAGGGGGGSNLVPTVGTAEVDTTGSPEVIIGPLDPTPPTASPAQSPAANGAGWNTTGVTVSWDWAESVLGSGINYADCTASSTSSGEGVQTLTATCTDLAGKIGTASYTVKVDETAPSLTSAPTTAANAAGWYNGDVQIAWTCSDAISGIPTGACPANSTITGEGLDLTASASVGDKAGNTTDATSSPVNIDRTPPVTTANAPNGWTNTDVNVTLSASDNLSGIRETDYTIDGGSQQTYQPGATLTFSAEGVHTLLYWSVDKAGNSETPHSVQIKIDKTPPTITNANAPAANSNGWNNGSVTVTFTCSDALSGIQSCDGTTPASPANSMTAASAPLATEGLGQLLTGTAVDNAGNTASDPVILNIDETPPTITGSVFPVYNAAGWNNSAVTVAFTCADPKNASNGTPGSGIASCSAPITLAAEGTGQSVTGRATDGAGNSMSTTVGNINIDETPPTITARATKADGTPYTAGTWTKQAVTVNFTCTDALSGIASCPAPVTVSAEGSHVAFGTASDKAGNTASASIPVNIDLTAPMITGSAAPSPNANGWYTAAVTVSFVCSDVLSGVVACPSPTTLSLDGAGQSVNGTAIDAAGNSASYAVSGINIDKTPPSLAPTVSPSPVLLNGSATASPNATDALSGVATQSCASVVTSSVGNQTVGCTATDKAGNTASKAAPYVVAYGQKLLYNTTTLYKSGTAVPIALQLQDAAAKNVSSASVTVTAVSVVNSSGTVVKTINAPFTFAKGPVQYTYSLVTTGLTTGSYNLQFTAGNDPTTHLAPFGIK